jgi:hypothetical protein
VKADAQDTRDTRARKADAVRLVITSRERAPRSPRMERALKRLIWRYCVPDTKPEKRTEHDDHSGDN